MKLLTVLILVVLIGGSEPNVECTYLVRPESTTTVEIFSDGFEFGNLERWKMPPICDVWLEQNRGSFDELD